MLRVSSYIIFVDLDDDSVMLLHGYAGSIDIVPRSVADLLRSRESVSCSDFDSELFEGLANRRYLTKLSQEEEKRLFPSYGCCLAQEGYAALRLLHFCSHLRLQFQMSLLF